MVTRRKGLLAGVDGLHLRGMEINDRRDGESTTLLSKGLFRTPTISLAMTARMLFSAMSTGMSTTMREDMTETINSMSKQFVRSAITTGRMPAVGDKTEIAWCDATWNPTSGCTRVSEGCRHCYIDRTPPFRMNGRKFVNGTTGVQLHPDRLDQPLKWKRPRRIFVNSLSDLFHEDVPSDFIQACFTTMAAARQHTFQILTKRPQRMRRALQQWHKEGLVFREGWGSSLPNVWIGVSIEDQATANERIPLLLETPAFVRFVSAEPLLGPVDLTRIDGAALDPEAKGIHLNALTGGCETETPWHLNWVIAGGESGPGARPCDVAWIRSIKDQCKAAGVPVFIKQMGGYVVDLNDAGFEGDESTAWPMDTDVSDRDNEWDYQGARIRIRLNDRKGGDWNEWPADLRVREYSTKGARHE